MSKNLLAGYNHKFKEIMSLSEFLEWEDPTPEGSKLSAFERQLKEQGILTKTIYEKGIIASDVEAFYKTTERKLLFPEYVATQLRQILGNSNVLKYLIGIHTPVNSNICNSIESIPNENKASKNVAEGSELPKSRKIRTRVETTLLSKYGRQLEVSYEALRRMKIDMLELQLKLEADEIAEEQAEEILSIIKNGDGNNKPAPVLKSKTDLDNEATSGTLSKKAWLRFLLSFYPYQCNTIVGDEDGLLQVLDILYPDKTSKIMSDLIIHETAKVVTEDRGVLRLIYRRDLEKVDDKPTIYGIDSRYCIEKLTEVNSDILEGQKFIQNQTEILGISENAGFSKMFEKSAKLLVVD